MARSKAKAPTTDTAPPAKRGRPPRRTLPEDWPEDAPTHKACPDCYAEGRDPYVLPIATHFYIKKVSNTRYKGGYRIAAYCIEHEKKRAAENIRRRYQQWLEEEARTGVTPPRLAQAREQLQRLQEFGKTPEGRERNRRRSKKYREEHPEEFKQMQEAWAAKPENIAARKAYRADWYLRVGKQRREERRRGAEQLGRSLIRKRAREAEDSGSTG